MFSVVPSVSWLAVLAATLASFILGGLWFTVLVGQQYAAALGREYEPKARPAPIFLIGPLFCCLITTVTSAILMSALHIDFLGDALLFGAIVGIGYVVTTMTNIAINPNFPRPFMYAAINAPYFILSNLLTSLILFLVR